MQVRSPNAMPVLNLFPYKIHIYDKNSTDEFIAVTARIDSPNRFNLIKFHYNIKSKTVDPSIIYSVLIQFILDEMKSKSPLFSLNEVQASGENSPAESMLFATFKEKGKNVSLYGENNIDLKVLEKLGTELGLKLLIKGSLVKLDEDINIDKLEEAELVVRIRKPSVNVSNNRSALFGKSNENSNMLEIHHLNGSSLKNKCPIM